MNKNNLITETRNELIRLIIETADIKEHDIPELVEFFYDAQDLRIRHANRKRTEPPSKLVEWFNQYLQMGEKVIHGRLTNWINSDDSPPEAKWAFDQIGIGAVLASGLSAHLDPSKFDNISKVWKFAGQAPGFDRRVKGQKLCFNSRLKVLCWKMGESFVKISNKEGATYGHFYAQFKAEEVQRNESGKYAEAAKLELSKKSFKTDNATKKRLLEGKLSDAHLHARAKRRAVKLFLSHYWVKGREAKGLPVTPPYPIKILGHDGMIQPNDS